MGKYRVQQHFDEHHTRGDHAARLQSHLSECQEQHADADDDARQPEQHAAEQDVPRPDALLFPRTHPAEPLPRPIAVADPQHPTFDRFHFPDQTRQLANRHGSWGG